MKIPQCPPDAEWPYACDMPATSTLSRFHKSLTILAFSILPTTNCILILLQAVIMVLFV